jgi:hypothetical protein
MNPDNTLDRRGKARLEVELKCVVKSMRYDWARVPVRTVNLSRSGVLLDWPLSMGQPNPKIGEMLRLDILLPAPPEFGERSISCEGMVVRVDVKEKALSVAMKIRRFSVGQVDLILSGRLAMRTAGCS